MTDATDVATDGDDPTRYTFNWQKLHEDYDAEAFLRWMVVHLMVDRGEDGRPTARPDLHDRVSAATDGFTNVTLTIQVGGVDVNVRHFVENAFNVMRAHADRAAAELIRERTDLTQLFDQVHAIRDAVARRTTEVVRGMGLARYMDEEDR